MESRDNQELELVITQPNTAKVRDAQELIFSIALPSTAKIRYNQDLVLVILANPRQPRVSVST